VLDAALGIAIEGCAAEVCEGWTQAEPWRCPDEVMFQGVESLALHHT